MAFPFPTRVLVVPALVFVTACVPAPSAEQVIKASAAPAPVSQIESNAWWTAFNDRTLNNLIASGLRQNLTVREAVERINEASAYSRVTSGIDLGASAGSIRGREDGGPIGTSRSAALEGTWLIDIFGATRGNRQVASARREQAFYGADSARLAVAGEIATTYIELRYAQEVRALTGKSLQSRQKSLDLISSQFDMGAATRLDVLRARQLVAAAEARQPALEVAFDRAVNRLATLTLRPASELQPLLQRGGAQPKARFTASKGVPAETLRRRPDVQAAEQVFVERMAQIGVAQRAMLPSISLLGSITSRQGGGESWSFGPRLNLPIFTGGAAQADFKGAQSRARQAWLAWQRTVLEAVEETRNALVAYQRDSRNIAAQQNLVSLSQETIDLAQSSYELGETDFLSILDTEVSLQDAREALAAAERDRAINYVRLSVATAASMPPPR